MELKATVKVSRSLTVLLSIPKVTGCAEILLNGENAINSITKQIIFFIFIKYVFITSPF